MSGNASARKGATKERQSKALLEAEGWCVTKAGGSLGAADLVALRSGDRPMMVQVKATARGGPFQGFGPAQRQELREVAQRAGAVAVLAHWRPYARSHVLVDEVEWP